MLCCDYSNNNNSSGSSNSADSSTSNKNEHSLSKLFPSEEKEKEKLSPIESKTSSSFKLSDDTAEDDNNRCSTDGMLQSAEYIAI